MRATASEEAVESHGHLSLRIFWAVKLASTAGAASLKAIGAPAFAIDDHVRLAATVVADGKWGFGGFVGIVHGGGRG